MSRFEEPIVVISDLLVEDRGEPDLSEVEAPRSAANEYGKDLLRQRLLAGVWRA